MAEPSRPALGVLPSARGGEGGRPYDGVGPAEQAAGAHRGGSEVPEPTAQHRRAMRGRVEPCGHDLPWRDAPRSREQILAEGRVSVARGVHARLDSSAARGVRELTARRDALALELGRPPQRRASLEACATLLPAGPVHETRDRARLRDSRCGSVVGGGAGPAGARYVLAVRPAPSAFPARRNARTDAATNAGARRRDGAAADAIVTGRTVHHPPTGSFP